MRFLLQRVTRYAILGLYAVSFQVIAKSEVSKTAYTSQGTGQAKDLFSIEWGLLIGVVLLALVVIGRVGKRPD